MADQAFVLHFFHRAELVVGWHLWINAMQLPQINAFNTEAA